MYTSDEIEDFYICYFISLCFRISVVFLTLDSCVLRSITIFWEELFLGLCNLHENMEYILLNIVLLVFNKRLMGGWMMNELTNSVWPWASYFFILWFFVCFCKSFSYLWFIPLTLDILPLINSWTLYQQSYFLKHIIMLSSNY